MEESQHLGLKKKTSLKCSLCGEAYKSNIKYDRHMKNNHGVPMPKSYQCQNCDQAFINQKLLSKHKKLHKRFLASGLTTIPTVKLGPTNPIHIMNDHNMVLPDSKNPINNLNEQKMDPIDSSNPNIEPPSMEESTYLIVSKGKQCKLCGIIFNIKTKAGVLNYHRAQHLGLKKKIKRFKCTLCDEAYKTENALDRHMLKKHGVPIPKPFQCPHCDQAFIRKKTCSKHMKTHKINNVTGVTKFNTTRSGPNNPINILNDHNMVPPHSKNQINYLKGQKKPKMDPHQLINSVFKLNQLHPGLEYETILDGGPPHAPLFSSTVQLNGQIFKGTGRSKKQAKENAAAAIFSAGLALDGGKKNLNI